MSFILDALRKLEEKRQQGAVPDIMTTHSPSSAKSGKRPLWPYVVVIVLLLNAVILAAWLRPWGPGRSDPALRSAVETERKEHDSAAAERMYAKGIDMRPAPEVRKPEVPAGVENTAPDSPESDMNISSGTPDTAGPDTSREAGDMSAALSEKSTADTGTDTRDIIPSPEELDDLRSKIAEERSSVMNEAPAEPAPEAHNENAEAAGVIEYSQLPGEIREELPDIALRGHIYSNNPAARIVNINGTITREGESVTEGLKVEEITMTGVVFDYRGFRFLIRSF